MEKIYLQMSWGRFYPKSPLMTSFCFLGQLALTLVGICAQARSGEGQQDPLPRHEILAFSRLVSLESKASFSRLLIHVPEGFSPKVESQSKSFRITIPDADLTDLGVPPHARPKLKRYLAGVSDRRIKSLDFDQNPDALVIHGVWVYPVGDEQLAYNEMEVFDFRQKNSSAYVVDFWVKPSPTLAEIKRLEARRIADKKKDEQKKIDQRNAEKQALILKKIEDSKNPVKFCEQPLDQNNTIFLKFRADHPFFDFSAIFPEVIPDHRFDYAEPKDDSEASAMIRLALKLTRDNRHALAVKTVDFFVKQHPQSKLLPQMKFLQANAFFRLDLRDQGIERIKELSKKYAGTDIGLQSAGFLAAQAYQRKEWLSALEAFNSILRDYPKNDFKEAFKFGVAESLFAVKQTEQALLAFQDLATKAVREDYRIQAAFKLGDVQFEAGQYAKAYATYAEAKKKYPQHLGTYPFLLLNMAESAFLLEDYVRAEQLFGEYLQYARSHPSAWRAQLRIAEIRGRDQPRSELTEKALVETINRYPVSPGAMIARLRLMPCGNHGGFDLIGATRFILSQAVQDFQATETFTNPAMYRELVNLTEVRTLISFGDDQSAIDRSIAHLQKNPSLGTRKWIESVLVSAIKRKISSYIENKEEFKAVETYEKYGDYLPFPTHDPLADQLRLDLARFAMEKGLTQFAAKLVEPYKTIDIRENQALIDALEKSMKVASDDVTDERILIDVIAAWNRKDKDILRQISLIPDKSRFRFERDLIQTLYFLDSDASTSAWEKVKKLSVQTQGITPFQRAQVFTLFAELAEKEREYAYAKDWYASAQVAKNTAESVNKKTRFNIRGIPDPLSEEVSIAKQGEMLEKSGDWKGALAIYTNFIENKKGSNRVLFSQARALMRSREKNSEQLAKKSLEKILSSSSEDVWKALARKALEGDVKWIIQAKEGETNENRVQ